MSKSDEKKQHTIDELRDHLFATLEGLRDKKAPMEVERAKAVATVAQVIVNSAKVEVDYLKAIEDDGYSDFLGHKEGEEAPPALPSGYTGRTVHRLR
jgi:hypothetical protein